MLRSPTIIKPRSQVKTDSVSLFMGQRFQSNYFFAIHVLFWWRSIRSASKAISWLNVGWPSRKKCPEPLETTLQSVPWKKYALLFGNQDASLYSKRLASKLACHLCDSSAVPCSVIFLWKINGETPERAFLRFDPSRGPLSSLWTNICSFYQLTQVWRVFDFFRRRDR